MVVVAPAPPPGGAPPDQGMRDALTFQGMWDLCDRARQHAQVSLDVAKADGRSPGIIRRWSVELSQYQVLQTVLGRIAGDDVIKQRLRVLAEQEAATHSIDDGEARDVAREGS